MQCTIYRAVLCIVILVPLSAKPSPALPDSSFVPNIRAGAVELGLSGALIVVETITTVSVSIRGGLFFPISQELGGGELELSYSHINSLYIFDLQGNLSWQSNLGNSAVSPFFAVGGGLRQEWLGSFRQIRYPIGLNLGLRTLINQHAAIRLEYKLRRILNDPIANFTEHTLNFGISLLLRNSKPLQKK
jgi:hypothetical protein